MDVRWGCIKLGATRWYCMLSWIYIANFVVYTYIIFAFRMLRTSFNKYLQLLTIALLSRAFLLFLEYYIKSAKFNQGSAQVHTTFPWIYQCYHYSSILASAQSIDNPVRQTAKTSFLSWKHFKLQIRKVSRARDLSDSRSLLLISQYSW